MSQGNEALTDADVEKIASTLPRFADEERRAEFPRLIREWTSWRMGFDRKASREEMRLSLNKVHGLATALQETLASLHEDARLTLARQLTPDNKLDGPLTRILRSTEAPEGLKHLKITEAATLMTAQAASAALDELHSPKAGRPRQTEKRVAACELAEIFTWATGERPHRRVRPIDLYGDDGGEYGPFRDFVTEVFGVIFGNASGVDRAVRKAVKFMEQNRTPSMAILAIRQLL
ncbi:MAG TPA: hypothetical protein VM325_15600 [Alphaproteobacteria bacterium]|nr:hypothetical protein [Alphaproteobacteria bacterium]